ncbi:MAG TPA: nodulation protein NfeD [Actinomycetota bacterium]
MWRIRAWSVLLASLVALGLGATAGAQEGRPTVLSLKLNGVVDPFVASYVQSGVEAANAENDAAVLLTIDTPGGLDSSMRQIIKAILASRIPVICYTAPPGARAASAGTFIMLACPIDAMAPGTNIGAAHPVGVAGAIEQDKVTNDAAAFIRSLADRWGRNADWAEDAVRKSVSVPAEEAVRIHVADLIAESTTDLLRKVDGRTLRLAGGVEVQVLTADATLQGRDLGPGWALLHSLIDPNLAFLFFYLGLALIIIEFLHPGLSVPGVVGTLMLISAFVTFGFLPVQLAGVILLIVSAVFFLLELKHPGVGLPTVGGVASLVLGGLLLFNPSVPSARVSPWLLAAVALGLVLFFTTVVRAVVKARHAPPAAGFEDMVGEEGVALDDLAPRGRVRARREAWSAESVGGAIRAGTAVRVVRQLGLRLIVEPVGEMPTGTTPETELRGEPAPAQGAGREGE